ncbi:MAG: ATP synthase subunit I [Thioalkalispiraceae bacterium]|jgi:F1F0 ATPase subunit 2
MNEWFDFVIMFIAGSLIGLVFYLGLWLTVRKLQQVRHPALLMLASLLLRFAFALAGFYLIAHYGGWQQLLVAVVGFTLIRIILSSRLRPKQNTREVET